jgi:exopolyphosphatase/guanosine-5'-triphosphate,3'-diphosphate pyrophosphatase
MSTLRIDVGATSSSFTVAAKACHVPVGVATVASHLVSDPPAPEELTNALGTVSDHVDDVMRELPDVIDAHRVEMTGAALRSIVAFELGHDAVPAQFTLLRDAADDVFRTVATEARAERAANPGLRPDDVDGVVAACCVVLGVMRRLQLAEVTVVE